MSCIGREGEGIIVGVAATREETICGFPSCKHAGEVNKNVCMRTCTVANNRPFTRPIVFAIAQHAQIHALIRG